MLEQKTILVVGTYGTKNDELAYIESCISQQGGAVVSIDVGVLGDPIKPTDYSKHEVAAAADSTIQTAIECANENQAMQIMAKGAATLAAKLYQQSVFDAVIILGGSMGTDLALDVCAALPLGVPKYIASTVAFSPLIPPHRLAADTQMILWAGGLYGLNSICKSSLSQAAGAILGAARAVEKPDNSKPLIGMTSLGSSALSYMIHLKPALEERGYEVAVFHATGMGGRAFEALAAEGAFVCVFDFCTQELGNHIHGSNITAGADRLTNAGKNATPQLIAPGCYDLVDIVGWQAIPDKWTSNPHHAHNRLITSIVLDNQQRRTVADAHINQLAQADSETVLLLPTKGCGEWDRAGAELHDPDGLAAFCDQLRSNCPNNVTLKELDLHINDTEFAQAALVVFDDWCAKGIVRPVDVALP